MCEASFKRTMAITATGKEKDMTLIQVTVIAGVFTAPQKQEIIERLTDAMAAIDGENMRRSIWCVLVEVAGGEWGIGGRTPSADDVKALARACPVSSRTGAAGAAG